MSDRITESRSRLFDALVPLLPVGRVSKYVPKSVVSPCIWIERHSWSTTRESNVAVVSVTWRIVVCVDGDDDQAQLDVLSSTVHDTIIRAKFRPLFADFQPIDTGGTSTTALVVTVEETVAATTLCLPEAPPVVTPIARKVPA
jgi:hypothetical protein